MSSLEDFTFTICKRKFSVRLTGQDEILLHKLIDRSMMALVDYRSGVKLDDCEMSSLDEVKHQLVMMGDLLGSCPGVLKVRDFINERSKDINPADDAPLFIEPE